MKLLTILLPFFAGLAAAQPVIWTNGIVNAASMAKVGLPNSAIAQGSMFVIFGEKLGPAYTQASSWPLPTANGLAGTSVEITAGGHTFHAIMLFTSPGQVAAVLPSSVPVGKASVRVNYQGQWSNAQEIDVVKSSFGIFAVNQRGNGPGVLQNWYSPEEIRENQITETASPGRIIVLWGTGLGAVQGDEAAGPLPGNHPEFAAKVYVGGKEVTPNYQGRSGCCAGVDQVVFQVPDGVTGCYVPVMVRINDVTSNTVTMAIGPNRRGCNDEVSFGGLNAQDFQNGLALGSILLGRSTSTVGGQARHADFATASFLRFNLDALLQTPGSIGLSTHGACTVYMFTGMNTSIPDPVPPMGLDAGESLTLTTPSGTKTLARIAGANGHYAVEMGTGAPQPFLGPGQYRISVPGGADVRAFDASVSVPEALTVTNLAAIENVVRTAPLEITWSGGDPNETVMIRGAAFAPTVAGAEPFGSGFVCLEKANRGSFRVPVEVLTALPKTEQGLIMVGNMPPLNRKISPTPKELDVATFWYQYSTVKNVRFQ